MGIHHSHTIVKLSHQSYIADRRKNERFVHFCSDLTNIKSSHYDFGLSMTITRTSSNHKKMTALRHVQVISFFVAIIVVSLSGSLLQIGYRSSLCTPTDMRNIIINILSELEQLESCDIYDATRPTMPRWLRWRFVRAILPPTGPPHT